MLIINFADICLELHDLGKIASLPKIRPVFAKTLL